jgi:hypothetical protein
VTTFRGHYLPVAARREVLRIYRDRRTTTTWSPFADSPLRPMHAMLETKAYFNGWLADAVAFGPVGRQSVEEMTAQYRAAEYYLQLMHDKPEAFKNRPPAKRHQQRDTRVSVA